MTQNELFSGFPPIPEPEPPREKKEPEPMSHGSGPEIFGMGYTDRGFFEELEANTAIKRVVDVRSSAWSRVPVFRGGALRARAESMGKEYVHLPALGGMAGTSPEATALRMRVIKDLGEGDCMVCMEADPNDCHRRTLLEPILLTMGFKVTQLRPSRNGVTV